MRVVASGQSISTASPVMRAAIDVPRPAPTRTPNAAQPSPGEYRSQGTPVVVLSGSWPKGDSPRALDWRAIEARLARLGSTVTTTADGRRLHYLHVAGEGTPILLLHGWPDTALMYSRLVPLLRDAGHPVVVPTSACFGHSDEPTDELTPELVADDVHTLMADLGYDRFVLHGTDWGATVASALAQTHPESIIGIHLLQPPFDRGFTVDRSTASDAELAYLTAMDTWSEKAAYVSAHLHSADTLAAALADSPVGLLAWIAERYDAWSSGGIDDDDLLATVATIWLTNTFRSSVRLYSEPSSAWEESSWDGVDADGESSWTDSDWSDDGASRIEIPTAFAVFPDDIGQPPRDFAERFFAVTRYTVMPRGGHWAALEEPHLVADDLLAFTRSL